MFEDVPELFPATARNVTITVPDGEGGRVSYELTRTEDPRFAWYDATVEGKVVRAQVTLSNFTTWLRSQHNV